MDFQSRVTFSERKTCVRNFHFPEKMDTKHFFTYKKRRPVRQGWRLFNFSLQFTRDCNLRKTYVNVMEKGQNLANDGVYARWHLLYVNNLFNTRSRAWKKNATVEIHLKAKIKICHAWPLQRGERESWLNESAWGVICLLKYTWHLNFFQNLNTRRKILFFSY